MDHYITATHETTDSETGAVLVSADLRIHYIYRPGTTAQTHGPADQCWPAEAAEVEVAFVERRQGQRWVQLHLAKPEVASPESIVDHVLQVWAEAYLDEHVDEVASRVADLEEQAAEYRAEAYADRY